MSPQPRPRACAFVAVKVPAVRLRAAQDCEGEADVDDSVVDDSVWDFALPFRFGAESGGSGGNGGRGGDDEAGVRYMKTAFSSMLQRHTCARDFMNRCSCMISNWFDRSGVCIVGFVEFTVGATVDSLLMTLNSEEQFLWDVFLHPSGLRFMEVERYVALQVPIQLQDVSGLSKHMFCMHPTV